MSLIDDKEFYDTKLAPVLVSIMTKHISLADLEALSNLEGRLVRPALEAYRRVDQAFYSRRLPDHLANNIGGRREQLHPPATEQDGGQRDLLMDIVVHAAPSMSADYELVTRPKTNLLELGDQKIEYIGRFLNSTLGSRWSKAQRTIREETLTLITKESSHSVVK